ncbi:MAG: ribonuclease III domain-containing protein [Solirubrobacterales bacterium]
MTDPGTAEPLEDEAPGEGAVAPLLGLIAELDPEMRLQALTHSSWTERRVRSWGRLAFLGDSVLGLAVAEHLFARFPRSDIGRLTKIHGQAVSGRACAEVAFELDVPHMLEESYPADFDGGLAPAELVGSERAMASIVESLIGACYLQFGLERTAGALLAAFAPQIDLASGTLLDFKSALQERLARRGRRVRYVVTEESGPPHEKTFRVEARDGDEVLGTGAGTSKKAAEQAAAAEALEENGS